MKLRRVSIAIAIVALLVFMVNVLWAQPGDDPAFEAIEGGTLIADSGFRANYNGFSFPNYGGDSGFTNLIPADVVYMFGEDVCASPMDEFGNCRLVPNAQLFLEEVNAGMDGGHCEGMAVLSNLFYAGYLNPADYGAEFVPDLWIEDNEFLQREIAYWFITQGLSPTMDSGITGTPTEVLEYLVENSDQELFTLGFYAADYSGGHAVTYYGVADMGGGIYRILLYDNNYPFEERFIEVDANSDTWVYTGATIPTEEAGLYYGDAETQTLSAYPLTVRVQPQVCPFCGDALSMKPGEFSSSQFGKVRINGRGFPVATDANGNQTGYVNGRYVNNIPGARINHATSLGLSAYRAPDIWIPLGVEYTMEILPDPDDPDRPATSVTIIQPGKVTTISGFSVNTAIANLRVTNDGGVSFSSPGTSQTITYQQAISAQNGQDYLLVLEGTSDSILMVIDPESGEFSVLGGEGDDTFTLSGERYDENGNVETFDAIDIPNSADDFFSSDPESWTDEITESEDEGLDEGDESAEDDSGYGDESAEDDSGYGDESTEDDSGYGDESAEDDSGYGDESSGDDGSADNGGEE